MLYARDNETVDVEKRAYVSPCGTHVCASLACTISGQAPCSRHGLIAKGVHPYIPIESLLFFQRGTISILISSQVMCHDVRHLIHRLNCDH